MSKKAIFAQATLAYWIDVVARLCWIADLSKADIYREIYKISPEKNV
jgi:hypothetical protein